MDQYAIEIKITAIFYDLVEIVELLNASNNPVMKEYATELKKQMDRQMENK